MNRRDAPAMQGVSARTARRHEGPATTGASISRRSFGVQSPIGPERGSVAQRPVRDRLAVADLVALHRLVADVEQVPAAAAVDDAAAEVSLDPVVAAAGPDHVIAVAGVDEVARRAAVETVGLARRLAGRAVVPPDYVTPPAGR